MRVGLRMWLDIPDFPPLVGRVDAESLVLGLNLIQFHGERLDAQRFNRPPASGGVFLGNRRRWVRAAYLLERENFLLEASEAPGDLRHSTGPVAYGTLLTFLLTWLYTDDEEGVNLTAYPTFEFEGDEQAALYWSQAQRRLLGLPAPPLPPEPPRTIEQQRNDGLRRMRMESDLFPEIKRLTARLKRRRAALDKTAATGSKPGQREA